MKKQTSNNRTKVMWIAFGIAEAVMIALIYLNFAAISRAFASFTDFILPVNCEYKIPVHQNIAGRTLSVKHPNNVAPGEVFPVTVFIQNTGNVPWFSSVTQCKGAVVNLGTERDRDRKSTFYNPEKYTGWMSENRIEMLTKRVDPEGIAVFEFTAKAPSTPGFYREYFGPVVEGLKWLDPETVFLMDTNVGGVEVTEAMNNFSAYINKSSDLTTLNLEKGKSIITDLSEQRAYLKVGDFVFRTMVVSTGHTRTPTPKGTFKIMQKQEVRIGGTKPHYIMPKFMLFKSGGYGIHGLPSLRNDKGVFWREAMDHIGTALSHGCIRMLPDDVNFVWNFVEIGTPVTVRA